MFANSQALGMETGFPDVALAPASKPAATSTPAASSSWMDAVLGNSPPAPAQSAASPSAMSPIGGLLAMLPSYQPQVAPSVAGGGVVPSIAALSMCLPNLPQSFMPPAGASNRPGG